MKISNKKGIEISNAFGAVLAVILVAILVIIAIFLFQSLSTGFTLESVAVTNETPSHINGTTYTVTNVTACNFQNMVVTLAANFTDGGTIPANNYTVDSSAGTITNSSANDLGWDNTSISYTYDKGGDACIASESMIDQFATYPALVGLVGTIVFLGLVIGVLVASFVFGGKRRV